MVAEALAGVKLSLVEIGVFQAAGELQRLQKGMGTFKKAMTQIVESESTSQTRRATGKLLYCCTARKRRRSMKWRTWSYWRPTG
jgi:hypothetical protein